jgi:hypothetical protein
MDDLRPGSLIQTFEPLFGQLGFDYPRNSAAYFVILILKFPTTFQIISSISKKISRENTPSKLRKARDELLRNGFIAQVYFADSGFGRESYLPINPLHAWNLHKNTVSNFYSKDDLEYHQEKINDFAQTYYSNFGPNGLGIDNGSITMRFSSHWLMTTLTSNIRDGDKLILRFGSLRSFLPPLDKYYTNMLDKNLTVRLFFEKDEASTEAINNLYNMYNRKIEIKPATPGHSTSRRFSIKNRMAADARKILALSRDEPSYVGTIYTGKKEISSIERDLDRAWS